MEIAKWSTGLGLALVASAGPLIAQQPELPMPVLDGSEPTTLVYGNHTTGATVGVGADADFYTFQGIQGQLVRVALASASNGLDLRLRVLDPVGALLKDSSCDGSSGYYAAKCNFRVELTLDTSGPHTLIVSDSGYNEGGSYTMQLECLPPTTPPPGIAYYSLVSDTISPTTDMDFVSFEGLAGTQVSISLQGKTKGFDPRLEVIGPTGELFDSYCDGSSGYYATTCTKSATLTLTATGTHYVLVSDAGSNETGNYNLGVDCYAGSCPNSPIGLTADVSQISLSAGGSQTFSLDAGTAHAGLNYVVLGTTAGFAPGFDLLGGKLPINIDGPAGYFTYLLANPNQPPLAYSTGVLDAAGKSNPLAPPTFSVPTGFNPGHAGLVFSHAFVALSTAGPSGLSVPFISNPVTVTLIP